MAFNPYALSRVRALANNRTLWAYETEDDAATVTGDGYFDTRKVKAGDPVIVMAGTAPNIGTYTLIVASTAGDTAETAKETAVGTVDPGDLAAAVASYVSTQGYATIGYVDDQIAGIDVGGGGGTGVTDGDKGDIVVSGSGTTWSLDSTVVTAAGRALLDDANAAAQRTTLGLGTIATQSASSVVITGGIISGITDLPVADGGTGASDAESARTNLGAAPLASPAFTGTPTVPTATAGTNTTQAASTAFVTTAVAAVSAGNNSYGAVRETSATGNITNTDAGDLVVFTGSTASQTLTLVRTSWVANSKVTLLNASTVAVTISAGTDGINSAGNDSFVLYPGEQVDVTYEGTTDPYWRAAVSSTLALSANQFAAVNSAGTAQEARTNKAVAFGYVEATANGTYPLGPWPNVAATGVNVVTATDSGTCSIQITKNGTAINGFASAVAQTTSDTTTASTESYANGNRLRMVISGASSLTGVFYAINAVRTGD